MTPIQELEPPPTVHRAARAMELARIWIVDGNQHVRLSANMWDDPGAWGIMLVDLAKHVANAYEERGRDRQEVLERILSAFAAELESATDDPSPLN